MWHSAIDKALMMGAAMDGGALKQAAQAHVKAIGSMDAKGVTTHADFEVINAELDKAIASVPTSTVMDVYNSSPEVPKYLMSPVKADDAKEPHTALVEFKDVVKVAR